MQNRQTVFGLNFWPTYEKISPPNNARPCTKVEQIDNDNSCADK